MKAEPVRPRASRDAHRDDQLVGGEAVAERAGEERVGGDDRSPPRLRATTTSRRARAARRVARRRVGEGDAADDGAAAAHRRVRDVRPGLGEKRRRGCDDARWISAARCRVVRADPDGRSRSRWRRGSDAVDVDDHGRGRKRGCSSAGRGFGRRRGCGRLARARRVGRPPPRRCGARVVERGRFHSTPPCAGRRGDPWSRYSASPIASEPKCSMWSRISLPASAGSRVRSAATIGRCESVISDISVRNLV